MKKRMIWRRCEKHRLLRGNIFEQLYRAFGHLAREQSQVDSNLSRTLLDIQQISNILMAPQVLFMDVSNVDSLPKLDSARRGTLAAAQAKTNACEKR